MIVTIDGTVGSGKSTAAAGLARRLGAFHLNTGTMYRAVTLKALETGADLQDAAAMERLAGQSTIELVVEDGCERVRLDGRDVTEAVRQNRVSTHSHYIARTPGVRQVLVRMQRAIAQEAGDVVAEGRDQGTVVFPNAEVKFFLDAEPEVRARRRQLELAQQGEYRSYRQVLEEVVERDRRDSTRQASPLRPADDAIHVDTSRLTIDEMIEALLEKVRQRCGDRPTTPDPAPR